MYMYSVVRFVSLVHNIIIIEAVHKSQGQLWQPQSGSLENEEKFQEQHQKQVRLLSLLCFCVCVDVVLTFIYSDSSSFFPYTCSSTYMIKEKRQRT